VPDGVDAVVDAVQAAGAHRLLHRSAPDARGSKLRRRNHPKLPLGDPRRQRKRTSTRRPGH
jgi:hypothetical protein